MADTSRRGFASMDPAKKKEIASRGGRAAHEKGTAHEFTRDEARQAGRKGGETVSRNRDHMAAIGRRGGEAVSRDREHMARIGRKGGEAVSRDRQHMAAIGREGGESRANKGEGEMEGSSSASHDKSEQPPPMSHAQSMEPSQKDGPSVYGA